MLETLGIGDVGPLFRLKRLRPTERHDGTATGHLLPELLCGYRGWCSVLNGRHGMIQ